MIEPSKYRGYAGFAGLILAAVNLAFWGEIAQGSSLRVTFFDVGQGDSIFIQTPRGHQILIDGGPNRNVAEKVGKTLPFWDKSLDLVILTHADADHITGLVDVFREYQVENVLWTGVEKDTNIYKEWKGVLGEEAANIALGRAGEKLVWSEDPNVFLAIVSPDENTVQSTGAVNDTSIVAALHYGEHSFLFPGDISQVIEQKLVNQGASINTSILKVPHHGSRSSNSENFLAAVSPEIAVIQVGSKNRYGHPTQEVLERFAAFGIPVLRTDLQGDILIQSNGNSVTYSSE